MNILYVIVGYGGTGAGGPGSAPLTPQQCKTCCVSAHSLLVKMPPMIKLVWSRPLHSPQSITSIYCMCLVWFFIVKAAKYAALQGFLGAGGYRGTQADINALLSVFSIVHTTETWNN